MNIDYFGSKRIYEYLKEQGVEFNQLYLNTTIESQYFSSMPPVNIDGINEIDKNIIESDFRKSFRNNEKSDILILDLTVERMGVAKYKSISVTLSEEVQKHIPKVDLKPIILQGRINNIPANVNKFVSDLSTYKKVILIDIYLPYSYIDENGIIKLFDDVYNINKLNAFIKTYSDLIRYYSDNLITLNQNDSIAKIENNKVFPYFFSEYSLESIYSDLKEHI